MRTINVRELRNAIPRLKEVLAESGELVLVNKGERIARLTPIPSEPPRRLPSLKAFRDSMQIGEKPLEDTIREERDRR